MISQHPDNAGRPYWHTSEYVCARHESPECYLSFSQLNSSEYKWDWEGKFVDESMIEQLLSEHYNYFKNNPLGKEKFITLRLPNPKSGNEFRLGRAFMVMLSTSSLAKRLGFHTPPIFEMILPMTQNAQEMIGIHEAFSSIASSRHKLLNLHNNLLRHIKVIPLFEDIDTIIHSDVILKKYILIYKKKYGTLPNYIRPYIARSDPALTSGIVPAVLAVKIALSRYIQFENQQGLSLFPILGTASLPFRGGLTPNNVGEFIKEYQGVKTALIQSAFRYDYDTPDVIRSIKYLEDNLQKNSAEHIASYEEKILIEMMQMFFGPYRRTVTLIAPLINTVADSLPQRRDRMSHAGVFGYTRNIGKTHFPRAISFTAALYSLGIPPEIIGTGRALSRLDTNQLSILKKYYRNISSDLEKSGKFLNKSTLNSLAKKSSIWQEIQEDVKGIEKFLEHELMPVSWEEKEHTKTVDEIHKRLSLGKSIENLLTPAALLRKSLG